MPNVSRNEVALLQGSNRCRNDCCLLIGINIYRFSQDNTCATPADLDALFEAAEWELRQEMGEWPVAGGVSSRLGIGAFGTYL